MGVRFEPHPFRQYKEGGEHDGKPMAQVMEDSSNAPRTVMIYVNDGKVKIDVLDRTLSTYEKEEDIILESHEFGPSDNIESFESAFGMFKLMHRSEPCAMFNTTGIRIEGLSSDFELWEEVENADVVPPDQR